MARVTAFWRSASLLMALEEAVTWMPMEWSAGEQHWHNGNQHYRADLMLGFGVRLWEGRLRSRGGFFPGATLDMNFANATYLGAKPSDLTVVRASVAYGTNADGSLTRFGVNVPRITALGLLIEAARTNSALQSRTLDKLS